MILVIRCPRCRRAFNARQASPYDIREGPRGQDIVTFDCPHCGARRVQFEVRRR